MRNFHTVLPFVCILLIKNKKILLGKLPASPRKPYPGKWDIFPAGKIEATDESCESAAKREALEETGSKIDNLKLVGTYLHQGKNMKKSCTNRVPGLCIAFTAESKNPLKIYETEEYGWFTKEEALKLDTTPWTKYFISSSHL